ncbi:hypothetical protein DFS13_14625 [Burkholderia sp. 28_3]|nr:hypothetical protein DFS13_14625 [Burkholderia sp. 28_3]QFR15835.1 hypothetical protein SK875_p00196 [Burkholderia contaminans]
MNWDADGTLRSAYVEEDVTGTVTIVADGIASMVQDAVPALV